MEITCPKGPGILPGMLLILWKLLLLLYHHQRGKECLVSKATHQTAHGFPAKERGSWHARLVISLCAGKVRDTLGKPFPSPEWDSVRQTWVHSPALSSCVILAKWLPISEPHVLHQQSGGDDISQGGCEDYTRYLGGGGEVSVNVSHFMGSSILSCTSREAEKLLIT